MTLGPPLRRPWLFATGAAVAAVAFAAGAGAFLGDDDVEPRRVGIPTPDETVATVLEDSTPVFVHRSADDDVRVIGAQPPARSAAEGTVDAADLVHGLVAWCEPQQAFVDDLADPVWFDAKGRGVDGAGLMTYPIIERGHGYVLVGEASRAADGGDRPPAGAVRSCGADREDHGNRIYYDAQPGELADVPAGQVVAVAGALDFGRQRLCDPPDDPLAWPLCPDGGAPVDASPAASVVRAEALGGRVEPAEIGMVGEFVVRADGDGHITELSRLPFVTQLRSRPQEVASTATLTGVGEGSGSGALSLVELDADDDRLDGLVALTEHTLVRGPSEGPGRAGRRLVGREAATALSSWVSADRRNRWEVEVLVDPLADGSGGQRLLRAGVISSAPR